MARAFQLEIVTPTRKFFSGEVEMVIVTTPDGQIGIMGGHTPMVATVAVGSMRMLVDGEWLEAFLSEGFMEVKPDSTIILSDTAEWPHEIDINRALAAKQRAEERLHSKLSTIEYMHSQAALARAMARLKVRKAIK